MDILSQILPDINKQNVILNNNIDKDKILNLENLESTENAENLELNTKSITKNIDKIIDDILNDIKSGKGDKILRQSLGSQISPNLTKDLKILIKELENSELKEFGIKLKNFLNPISDLKSAAPLKDLIKNSGIGLETKLLNNENLPPESKKLLQNIKNSPFLDEILKVSQDLNTKDAIKNIKILLENKSKEAISELKDKKIFKNIDEIKNLVNFLNKSKNIIPKNIDTIIKNLKSSLESFQKNNKYVQELKQNIKEIEQFKNDIKKENLEKNINFTEKEEVKNIDFFKEKINLLSKKLNQFSRNIEGFEAKNTLQNSKIILKQLKIIENDFVDHKAENIDKNTINDDLKSNLLNIINKADTNLSQLGAKMLSQIELLQIISAINGGIYTFVPYLWEDLENGRLNFKVGKKNKFYAQINLSFKEYGKINIMLGLELEKYLDISISTSNKKFENLISENLIELKKQISELGLIIGSVNLKQITENQSEVFELGFDKKA